VCDVRLVSDLLVILSDCLTNVVLVLLWHCFCIAERLAMSEGRDSPPSKLLCLLIICVDNWLEYLKSNLGISVV